MEYLAFRKLGLTNTLDQLAIDTSLPSILKRLEHQSIGTMLEE